MVDVTITAASVLASGAANKKLGRAGATLTAGQAVYEDLSDNNDFKLADADGTAAQGAVAGITLNGAADGQPVEIVISDTGFTPGGTLVDGTLYVLSGTAGAIAPVADLAAGDRSVVLMVATSTTVAIMKIVAGTSTL